MPTPLLMKMMKRWGWIVVLALMCWWGLATGTPAQGTSLRLESRLDRLESEVSRVQSRLNQIEARNNIPSPTPLPANRPSPLNELSSEEQFDNLATLAIELRQDVRDLQARVAELESGDR